MLFLALAVACSTAIAVIFKITEGRMDRTALLTANYVVAVMVSGARLAMDGHASHTPANAGFYLLAMTLGTLFILGFALFSKAIGVAGMSLATATMRLSVAVPFLASWFIWSEVPTPAHLIGLALAGGAFVLISRRPTAETAAPVSPPWSPSRSTSPLAVLTVLAALFAVGGLVDTSLKVFEEEFARDHSRQLFLLVVFGVAFLIGATLIGWRGRRTGRWPRRDVIWWGIGLGAANYASVEFILLALQQLPGTIVFPANNVAIVALATLLGVAIWRETLSRMNKAGLLFAALALILLTS